MDRPVRRFGKHRRDQRPRPSDRGERIRTRDDRARAKQALRGIDYSVFRQAG